MKSTLLKLTVLSFLSAILIGCASPPPPTTAAGAEPYGDPMNRGDGLTSVIH